MKETGWNFYGHIALPLETMARTILPNCTIKAMDIVENQFVAIMFHILDYKHIEAEDFCVLCSPYVGEEQSKIPDEDAIKMWNEFQKLVQV